MSDLVERLRRMADMTTTGNDLGDITRAANEIERLRAEHAMLFDLIKDDALLVERFNAAVERRLKARTSDSR